MCGAKLRKGHPTAIQALAGTFHGGVSLAAVPCLHHLRPAPCLGDPWPSRYPRAPTCSRALQTCRWTVSSVSSSRAPAVSSPKDPFSEGGGGWSCLRRTEKGPLGLAGPAPEAGKPPSLEVSEATQVPGAGVH